MASTVAAASYFRRASLFWMALITLSMGFFTWTVFFPEQIPYEKLGPFGSFVQYLVKNHYGVMYHGFWVAWIIHLLEALYSMRLCSSKGIKDSGARTKWLLQTFLFGAASLLLLIAYKPAPSKKRR
ncbi:transmembrane protein 254 [Spea bombifrons]|uniref:transmembrane protein 254 n=1 Tax=Spea bombifrons TaxID=233779 RepID=UPI00234ACD67|nr:transmembrane protein 254 [Spea bombifrons]